MKPGFFILLSVLALPMVQYPQAEGSVPFEARVEKHERLVEILKADSAEVPSDILVCTHAVCKRPFASKRKGESSFFEGRVENGALLRAAACYNAVNTINWLLKERKADPNDMMWDNYGSPLGDEVSALHIAAQYGAFEAAEALLTAGANPNAIDKNGNTPLISVAISVEDEQLAVGMVQLLLKHGADPARRNYEGKSAADYRPMGVVGMLLGWNGVLMTRSVTTRADRRAQLINRLNLHTVTFGSREWNLRQALLTEDLESVQSWIDEGVDVNGVDEFGNAPLLLAVRTGNADMVRLLMRHGAEFPAYGSAHYFLWMYSVVLCGNPDILDLVPYYEPKYGVAESPFLVALRGNCGVEMAAALLERGANAEARSLYSGRECTCHQIVRLYTKDAEIECLLKTRLQDWSLADEADALQDYLKLPGFFAVDKRGSFDCTPYTLFLQEKNESAANALLAAGADAASVRLRRNPETKQLEYGQASVVQGDAEFTKQTLQAMEQNDTAYFMAMASADLNRRFYPVTCATCEFDPGPGNGRYYMGAALRFAAAAGKTDIVRVLIARRADLEEADVFGKTAIVQAAANGHVECVRLLLNAGAVQHGRALQMAALCGQHAVVDYLLSRGVRPGLAPEYALMSAQPHTGLLALRKPDADVALGLAVQLDSPDAVKRLIAAGANVNRPNFFPLHVSFESDLLKVLVEAGADVNRKNKDGLTPLEYHRKNGNTAAVEYLESVPR